MSSIKSWCSLIGIDSKMFSKEENFLVEAELFKCICEELKEIFREQHKAYFRLMKFTLKKEEAMLEANFTRLIIQDILSTNEYNIQGIAYYTTTPEEVVEEILGGLNINPSAIFLQRIIDLHRSVRNELYNKIIKKIISKYSELA